MPKPLVCYLCGSPTDIKCKTCDSFVCRAHALPVGYSDWLCSKCASK